MNVLANEINLLDCEMRKTKRDQIIVASRQDSLLAARQLGLPTCQTIQATEKMAIVHQCETLNMEVKAEITRCGPQPRLGNHSIEMDGWRLAPFTACRFTAGIIPLNGEFFRYENGEWVAVEANIKLSHQKFVEKFDIEADEAIKWIPQKQAEHDFLYSDQINVLTDLVSTMKENNIRSFSQLAVQNSWSDPLGTIKRKLWEIVLGTLIAIVLLLIVCSCMRSCFCCRLCYFLCQRCRTTPMEGKDELQLETLHRGHHRAIDMA